MTSETTFKSAGEGHREIHTNQRMETIKLSGSDMCHMVKCTK